MNAFSFIPENLGAGRLTFRISAPGTMQRAAFHENDSADSRPVIDTKLLDIEYGPAALAVCFFVIGFHNFRIGSIGANVNKNFIRNFYLFRIDVFRKNSYI